MEAALGRESRELAWAGVAGALVALVYQLVKAQQAGDIMTALHPTLLPIMGIGALAGVAAIWLRSRI